MFGFIRAKINLKKKKKHKEKNGRLVTKCKQNPYIS